jgi:CheY-like chemotaxis protein
MNVTLKRILLVEDSVNDVKLMLMALRDVRIANEVVVARDGEEALDYLYRRGIFEMRGDTDPVVVLMDLKLPKLTGLEVLERLRRDPNFESLPIVMITSSAEDEDVAKSYQLRANAYVIKPLHHQEFLDAVKEIGCFWGLLNCPPPGASEPRDPRQGPRGRNPGA